MEAKQKLPTTPPKRKGVAQHWVCVCGEKTDFGAWYAAHAYMELTGTCKACKRRFLFQNYKCTGTA